MKKQLSIAVLALLYKQQFSQARQQSSKYLYDDEISFNYNDKEYSSLPEFGNASNEQSNNLSQRPIQEAIDAIADAPNQVSEKLNTNIFGGSSDIHNTLNGEEPGKGKPAAQIEPVTTTKILVQRPIADAIQAIEEAPLVNAEKQNMKVFGTTVGDVFNTLNGEEPGKGKQIQFYEPETSVKVLSQRPFIDAVDSIQEKQSQKPNEEKNVFGDVDDVYNTLNGEKPGNGKVIPFSEPALDFKILSQNSAEADEISVNQESLRSRSMNDYDNEYLQTQQSNFARFVNKIKSPQDLDETLLIEFKKVPIDGKEKFADIPDPDTDDYYNPAVFGSSVYTIFNTHHGYYPRQYTNYWRNKDFEPTEDKYSLRQAEWQRK